MKPYKQPLSAGFQQQHFTISQNENHQEQLPWWIEDQWILQNKRPWMPYPTLYVIFLTIRSWESGPKIVDEIVVMTSLMKDYMDRESVLISMDMRKGDFEGKLEMFFEEFEKEIRA